MIKKIMAYLERIGADQISFRRLGFGEGSHLNIMVQQMNDLNQSGCITVTDKLLREITTEDYPELFISGNLDDIILESLLNNYNYSMNDKSPFFEETCPNCGAQEGEYEVQCMGNNRNKRTCLRCRCTWFGYEYTAEMVSEYIKKGTLFNTLKDSNDLTEDEFNNGADKL